MQRVSEYMHKITSEQGWNWPVTWGDLKSCRTISFCVSSSPAGDLKTKLRHPSTDSENVPGKRVGVKVAVWTGLPELHQRRSIRCLFDRTILVSRRGPTKSQFISGQHRHYISALLVSQYSCWCSPYTCRVLALVTLWLMLLSTDRIYVNAARI